MNTVRIYVACLSSYNAGVLHGAWIDATKGVDHIQDRVNIMLAASKEQPAEEWAIHDYEGFEGVSLSEYESFQRVADIAELIEEHGKPFAVWYKNQYSSGSPDDKSELEEAFRESYVGEYESAADYAEQFADDCGYLKECPDHLKNYIDWESMARDWQLSGDIWTHEEGYKTTYIFRNV